jgi:hypothetical protein
MLGIEKNIDFHSAISDAEYTAKVFEGIDFGRVGGYFSIDTYRIPAGVKDEIITEPMRNILPKDMILRRSW